MAKGRAQCIVVRNGKFLAAKHCEGGRTYYVIPGGGIENGETPEQAALRELFEDANVKGVIIRKLAEYADAYNEKHMFYSYLIDIGEQTPTLGYDPEFTDNPVLAGIEWKSLDEISQRDRMYFFAGGLASVKEFVKELDKWSDDIDYPKIIAKK